MRLCVFPFAAQTSSIMGGRRDTSQFGVLDDFTKLNLSELSPLAIAGS
jgi:hypothetical protein